MWSIKQLTDMIEKDLRVTMSLAELTHAQRLETVMLTIIDRCAENRRLFNVVLTYLLQAQKSGKDPDSRVKRRTIRLRHLMSQMFIAGINAGEFRAFNVKDANELFYGLVESAIFRIAILDHPKADDVKDAIILAVKGISIST